MPDRKPPRMRAACGQCHSAKVKCSGERTGCSRCLKLGLECTYGVSMVGRASKRKTADQAGLTGNPDEILEINIDDMTIPGEDELAAHLEQNPGEDLQMPDAMDPSLELLPSDLMSVPALGDFSFNHFHLHPDADADAPFSFTSSSNASTTTPSSTAASQTTPAPGYPEMPASLSDEPAKRMSVSDSAEPIFWLARVTLFLEQEAAKPDLPLDRTLKVVKDGLRQVMDVVTQRFALKSLGCRGLIFASIQSIVKMYSRSLQLHRQGATGQPEATFKLGSFEIDPEDQLKLQYQLVAAELGRCIRSIKMLSLEWSRECAYGDNCHGVQSYRKMTEQMNEMREDLENAHIRQIRQELEKASVHDKRLVHPLI